MTVPDRTLLQYIVAAMEPSRAVELEAQLAADPALHARLVALRAEVDAARAGTRWAIPPPGIAAGKQGFWLGPAPVAVMGAATLRAGERFAIHFDDPDDRDRLLVVLHRQGGEWQIVFPASPDEEVLSSELQTDERGARVLDLSAGPDSGDQRWAVALPTRADGPRWAEDDPWVHMRTAMAEGDVPVTAHSVRVS